MVAPLGLAANQAEYEFEAGKYGAHELSVVSWEAEEELSRVFELEVELSADDETTVDIKEVLGKDAKLTIHLAEGGSRCIHGIVRAMRAWDAGSGSGRKRFRCTVVPSLWRLGQMKRSRIFQDMSVVDIAKKVLGAAKVEHKFSTSGSHGKRNYCVQYRESDLDFVQRLCEEEGIFYFFEHDDDKHTVVFGDASSVHKPIGAGTDTLMFRELQREMVSDEESIFQIAAAHAMRPGAVVLRDFAFKNPSLDLDAPANADGGDEALEIYDYPGEYIEPGVGKSLAKMRMEELTTDAETVTGATFIRRLTVGHTFTLDEHPEAGFNKKYLVRAVRHVGRQPQSLAHSFDEDDDDDTLTPEFLQKAEPYRAEFFAQPHAVPFRPRRTTPRPIVHGPQTAIVVGPSGEEIHTDEHGRVKVQFHWDREGKNDDKSSCWVRVSQFWAGPGWGALYLPRIGQEVIVEFLEGDPDRPLITGRVYNGHNPPPVNLPGEKTKSTLRSNSSTGGGGSNELMFEDAAGHEQVYLHAQKDWDIVVENDKSQEIGGNESLKVTKDRTKEIEGNQTLHVVKDDQTNVDGNQSLAVSQNRSVTVGGNHSEKVVGAQTVDVGGTHTLTIGLGSLESVGAAKALNVGAAYAVNVGGAMMENVIGMKVEAVGAAKVEVVIGNKSETVAKGNRMISVGGNLIENVAKDKKVDVKKNVMLKVGGALQQSAKETYGLKAKEVAITAEEGLKINVGDVTVEFAKNGDATIKAKKLEITAKNNVIIKGSKIETN
jgi:type VI secretion system secreted protein VgrG